jgi:hypothetical protein
LNTHGIARKPLLCPFIFPTGLTKVHVPFADVLFFTHSQCAEKSEYDIIQQS